MIKFYTWSTPNGMKVQIMLEECALPYELVPVNLGQKQQHASVFRAINPNGKIPAIIDDERPGGAPFTLWESGAILIYLAEKCARFVPSGSEDRHRTNQWIMFQMSGLGPMIGQLHHFTASAPEPISYAIDRYKTESRRLLTVLDGHLDGRSYIVGEDYSIADVCMWPWTRSWLHTVKQDFGGLPNVRRWFETIEARPAVRKSVETYNALRNQPSRGT